MKRKFVHTVACRAIHVAKMTGSGFDDWIYWLLVTISLNHIYYSAIAGPILVTQLKHRKLRFKSLQILHINKIFEAHFKFLQANLPYSSVLPVSLHSILMVPPLFLSASSGILLTHIAEGQTSTNSKHISSNPYPLLLCDTDVWCHRSCASCQTHRKHSLLYCCKQVLWGVLSVIAWQCVMS
jgi:hypothetical protein